MPAALFPWFFAGVVAVIALWRERTFLIDWILAVLVPYSAMSSKLDVYMMALIPPVALLIADLVDRCDRDDAHPPSSLPGRAKQAGRLRAANALSIALVALIGLAGLFVSPRWLHGPEGALLTHSNVRFFFAMTALLGIIALIASLRVTLRSSTLLAGATPVMMMVVLAILLMPEVNEISSTRPLVEALRQMNVPPAETALYAAPYLWTRDLPAPLENVVYADIETLRRSRPSVIVTARAHAGEIAFALAGYRKTAELRMIGKWFDVYRR